MMAIGYDLFQDIFGWINQGRVKEVWLYVYTSISKSS